MTTQTLEATTQAPGKPGAGTLRSRMGMAILALIGVIIAAYMSIYKLGIIPEVACGAGACEVVQASPFSVFLGVPVPFWGVFGYGLILTVALLGLQPRFRTDRRIAALLLAASTYAFGFSAWLSYTEAVYIRAWCRWCIASAAVATLLFLLSLAEITRLRGATS